MHHKQWRKRAKEGWTGGRMSGKLQTLHLKVYDICLIIGLIIIDANIDTKDQ